MSKAKKGLVYRPTREQGDDAKSGARAYIEQNYKGEWRWNVVVPLLPDKSLASVKCVGAGVVATRHAARAAARKALALHQSAEGNPR